MRFRIVCRQFDFHISIKIGSDIVLHNRTNKVETDINYFSIVFPA